MWDAMGPYGKALSASMALYAYLFCDDLDIHGHRDGYPIRYFYRYFDILQTVITDSASLANELRTRFQIPPSKSHKLVILQTPVTALQVAKPPCHMVNRRPQVFWSGRFDRQKRVDVVMSLAARMAEIDFHLWGRPVLDHDFNKLNIPNNVFLQGVYKDLAHLPLEHCDLWLYTSQWDGVPNILLEVAAAGIPLVGSLAGGTGEVLLEDLCIRIADVCNIDAFETAILRVLENPREARKRARRLRELVLSQRNPATYRSSIEALLSPARPND
jgi:glycosyltransferase involved in cell wall biosynthesis